MKKVFNKNGIYMASETDYREDVIGFELEYLFAPTTHQFRELCVNIRALNRELEDKPSLIQVRSWSRFYFLDRIKWFVANAEEDGILDELIFYPTSKELIYRLKDEIGELFVKLCMMGYAEKSALERIGIHHNIEIDFSCHDFYRFCKSATVLRDLLYKVSNRIHLSSDRSDMDFFIGNRWGHFTKEDKATKYEAFINILVEGFKKKRETNLLGIRIYPDGRPLIELMWYGSTLDVDVFYTQVDFTYSLKTFSKSGESITKKKYMEYIVDHKYDFPYLYKMMETQCEEFSITALLNGKIGLIT